MSVNAPNAPAPAPRAMLPPPEERLYASFQDLQEDLKKWTLVQGYALSIDASSNRDATGMYRRYNMSCVKGGKTYKPTAQGKRRSYSKKTGCPMKIKCTKQDGWPWNGRWRVTVMCADHNHAPFDPDSPDDIPPAFRHVEGEGLRWLLIMHREAQLNLRQLTIGLRVTFGDKYKFIKKADVSNMLSKVKREEERELAKRPPGAPPLPPGTMTAFMAALLNPVPDPYANGVRYDLVSETWPNVPGYQSATSIQQQQQQQHQQQPLPQGQPQYTQQTFQPQQYGQAPPQQMQAQAQQIQGLPQQYNSGYTPLQQPQQQQQPQQPNQSNTQATFAAGQRPLQWKNYGPPLPAQPQAAAPQQVAVQQPPQQQQPQQQLQQQQAHHSVPQQAPPQQQQQQLQVQQPPQQAPQQPQQPQQQQQQPPPQQQPARPQQAQQVPVPTTAPQQQQQQQQPPFATQPGPQQRPVTGSKSLYRPSSTLQPVSVAGVPGAVVMPRSFSPVSEDESDEPEGYVHNNEEEEEDDDDGNGDGDGDDE